MKLNIHDLYAKPASYKFSKTELSFIRKYLNKKRKEYRIKYAFYNKKSSKKKQIAFIIDSSAFATRSSGVENYWDYFCEREISDIEFEEIIQNFGCNKRRFQVWYYRDIDALIVDDQKYNITTPKEFVEECRKRNYSGTYQTIIDFNLYNT